MNGNDNELVWAAVRVFVALPIVLIMAYLLIKYGLSRRYSFIGGTNNKMKLVEQLPLGPKAMLSLVVLGDKYYLLAHQDNSMQLIKELDQLPVSEKAVSGDVVELIPRSVLDIDKNVDKAEKVSVSEPGFVWNRGVFSDLPQKGRFIRAVGWDYVDKFRALVNRKDQTKRE
ncbi:MAG: flagellar biosynthetic protein FliO [Peptococcaceae bacterium]|nr:flagellar biosynthetic protein FliO [Peptococcaceae bacterium]